MECRGFKPQVDKNVYLAPGSHIIGDVTILENSSVWFNTVIRGDVMPIRIGRNTNIQDNSVIHGTFKKAASTIGNYVTIGHSVILHGCEIGDYSLIGMGSIVMDGAKIGKNCIVGAGSLVTEGSVFPDNSLILGRPAKIKRELTQEELAFLPQSAANYQEYTTWYR